MTNVSKNFITQALGKWFEKSSFDIDDEVKELLQAAAKVVAFVNDQDGINAKLYDFSVQHETASFFDSRPTLHVFLHIQHELLSEPWVNKLGKDGVFVAGPAYLIRTIDNTQLISSLKYKFEDGDLASLGWKEEKIDDRKKWNISNEAHMLEFLYHITRGISAVVEQERSKKAAVYVLRELDCNISSLVEPQTQTLMSAPKRKPPRSSITLK